jgi:NAD-dependent SIR2 family protein deacetylase
MMKDYEILDSLKDTRIVLELHKETYGDITVPPNVTAVIDELIEKYTPRVPKGETRKMYCSKCGRRIRDGMSNCRTRDVRCQKCGQIIEWD